MNTKENKSPLLTKVLLTVFFIILCILFLIPLYALLLGTFKGGAELFVSGLNLNPSFELLHTKAWKYLFTGVMSNGEYNPHDYFLWYKNSLLVVLLGYLYFYAYPLMWLRRTLRKRHFSIMCALPFVLDLLTLSVEAGMDFMSALQRNCDRRRLDPLNEELIRMTREIQMGAARRVALRNMAERVRQPDLKAVSFALIQADELGVPIGPILRIQSDQLRARRFDRAERLASEAPVKMLGPLLLCIFPAVLIVLLAPILLEAVKNIM